ncbi:hypothetical protein SNE40_022567 [Patella caerulea]|uniref:Uncharacterized protein n=1 Tax=Patella caerulea TaxID=87958 RepID=A0AAN8GB24_PATCE
MKIWRKFIALGWIFALLFACEISVCDGQDEDEDETLSLVEIKETNPDLSVALSEYDVNGDGILDVDEIDLSYSYITAAIDKHQHKDKKFQEDKEEEDGSEENEESQKDSSEEDKRKIEKRNEGEKKQASNWILPSIIVATVLGAMVTALVFFLTKQEIPSNHNIRTPAGSNTTKREEWLNRISQQNKNESRTQSSSNKDNTPGDQTLTNEKPSDETPSLDIKDDHLKDKEKTILYQTVDKTSKQKDDEKLPDEVSKIDVKDDRFKDKEKTVSNQAADKLGTDDVSSGTTPKPCNKEQPRQLTLVEFLECVLNCKIEIKNSKTHYSLGSLTIKDSDFPVHSDDIPEKIGAVMKLIIPRQINKMKYVLNIFDGCEVREAEIKHDDLIISASKWLKNKAISVIFETIKAEDSEASAADDLWTDYGSKDVANDAVVFLRRISGWSEDGVVVSPGLLSNLLDYSCHGNKCVDFLVALIQAAGRQIKNVKRLDEMVLQESNTLKGLEILLSNVNLSSVLAVVLQKEINSAAEDLGIYFENHSIFGPLLSVTSIPTTKKIGNMMSLTGNSVIPFVELQKGSFHPKESDLRILEKSIQDCFHQCQDNIYNAMKKVVSNKSTREAGLAWLATLIGLNDLRTASLQVTDTQSQTCCSDGFMLNFCAVMLKFFIPIYGNKEKIDKIDLRYSTSSSCRLNYHFETCLAAGQIVSEKENQKKFGALPEELQNQHSFITECFHLTQRALSIGVIPAIIHYNHMHRDLSNQIQAVKDTPKENEVKRTHVLLNMMWETSLADVDLVKNITMFYLTQADLLLQLTSHDDDSDKQSKHKDERLLFQQIPEFCVKDMAVWFQFVAGHAIHVHKGIMWGLQLSRFVDCCVVLLERPDIMPGPIVASKLVSTLLLFVQSSPHNRQGTSGWSGTSAMSDLGLMVHTSPTVQSKLGPALLHTYISVDVVEGLDVDKDEFDKYTARSQIGQLIRHLWDRPDCKQSILQQHLTPQFQNFLGAILDTLLYMLHDALSRMANVKRSELAKDNVSEWNSLSSKEQHDRTLFLMNEEHAGRGFMALANQTLSFILLLTEEEVVSACFNRNPLAQRSASAICGFLLSLCGAKAKDYKVKNMAKYNFDPKLLLTNIVKIILHICKNEESESGFKKALAEDSDFELEAFQKAFEVIYSKGLTGEEFVDQFANLIVELKELQNSVSSSKVLSKQEFDWLKDVVTMEINQDELIKSYTNIMASLRFETSNLAESHSYQSNVQAIDPRSPKVKTLMKEMKQLQQNLPVHPHAAIYVRQDEDRMDLMRAMITGPVDTPYSGGCFFFDVYFPTTYPNNPPLVKLITTGNGTVRFNPNLYSDGKVCLSLLGTWHAGDASEKWNPGNSSLYQVLVSIQSIILTSDPMFNEPGYDGMRETEDGKKQSGQYNWKIQLHTLRHAILGNIRHPPPGFEDLIKRHYYIQKDSVLKQCAVWIEQCEDEDLVKRMRIVCDDIYRELQNIELPPLHKDDSEEELSE